MEKYLRGPFQRWLPAGHSVGWLYSHYDQSGSVEKVKEVAPEGQEGKEEEPKEEDVEQKKVDSR
jgi:hypothetical protein